RDVNERLLRDAHQRGQKLAADDFEKRAQMAVRYGNEPPASRDSNERTLPVELVDGDVADPRAAVGSGTRIGMATGTDPRLRRDSAGTGMAARYGNEPPASRDSGNQTMPVERDELRYYDPREAGSTKMGNEPARTNVGRQGADARYGGGDPARDANAPASRDPRYGGVDPHRAGA